MKNIFICLLILFPFINGFLFSQVKTVAILNLNGKNILSDFEVLTLTDKLVGELFNTEKFKITEREQLEKILKKQDFQSDCNEQKCAVEIGKLVGVDAVIYGSIGRIGSIYMLNVKMLDVQTGAIIQNITENAEGSIENLFLISIPNVAMKLSGTSFSTQTTQVSLPVQSSNTPSASTQIGGTTLFPRYIPQDSSKIIWGIGVGIGVPYGTFGGKFSLGTGPSTGDIGFGLFPFIGPAVSISGVINFRDRYDNVRPQITLTYSNITAGIVILEISTLKSLYSEAFPGVGIYAGVDWRLTKTSPFCIDLNIGGVFSFAGKDEIMRKYDEAVNDLKSRGYITTEEKPQLSSIPKISIGITYSPGRNLKLIYGY